MMRKLTSTCFSALMMTTALSAVSVANAQDFAITEDQIIVRGVNIPDEKRATSEISSVLTPEKLQRQGDADIAEALRRVTGLSLSQGKFIVVRGLNERYSNLTLNGSPLPSPEPLRRVAPLDLFPTSVIGTALVQKTFSPEFSGEFGGGLIELRSKGLPDEPFFDVRVGATLDTESTAKDGLTFDGGEWDWAGFGDSTYNVPSFLAGAINANPGVALREDTGILQPFEAQAIGAQITQAETLVVQEADTPVNHNVNVSGGTRWDLDNGMSIGLVGSAGYIRDFQIKVGQQGTAGIDSNTGEAVQGVSAFDFESLTETVRTNGLLSLGVEFDDNHELNLTGIVLRKSTKEARERLGVETPSFENGQSLFSNLEFFENQVWSGQANSEHIFPSLNDLTVRLRGSYSEAYREAPYETEFLYVNDGNVGNVNGVPVEFRSAIGLGAGASGTGFETRFSQIDDTTYNGGIDLELPFFVGDVDITLKAGYAYNNVERDYIIRRFQFANDTGLPDIDPFFFQRIDFLLSDPNMGPGGLIFQEAPDQFQPGAYNGQLETHAAYFGTDIQLTDYLRAAAGFRYESGEQFVDNFNIAGIAEPIPNDPTPESNIDEDYFLPAVTLTWNPLDDIQVRAGFSQTITRPQFQELGDALFTDTDRDLQTVGNPFLVNTQTNNFDVRFEYYFGREQYITIGGFYKDIENPIEEALTFTTVDDINVSYLNAPSADLYGFEFEYEQRFELANFLKLGSFSETKDLVVAANYTWSDSEVSADGDVQINVANSPNPPVQPASNFFADGRRLQGQSEHIVNVQMGWEDFEANSKLFLLVNWASERIRQVGILSGGSQVPDTVERLPVTVDLVYSRGFEKWGGNWEISGKVGNILNDRYEATADGTNGSSIAIDVYELGTTVSLSLKRSF
ncbi:MAG: TonB-dependent receptor [Pseudomonadota bacterium]